MIFRIVFATETEENKNNTILSLNPHSNPIESQCKQNEHTEEVKSSY